jgi:hypothetical protein
MNPEIPYNIELYGGFDHLRCVNLLCGVAENKTYVANVGQQLTSAIPQHEQILLCNSLSLFQQTFTVSYLCARTTSIYCRHDFLLDVAHKKKGNL